jgi:DNA-binding PadR family transcriptional regulator
MSARHALLGLLLDRPAYRYQLGERLQERLGPAWAINSGQLYQTTKRLEKAGLIERVDSATEDQDRDIFAITDDGADEFERWFSAETSRARLLRRPLLAKIALAGPRRLKGALEQIDAYERDCAARLKELSTKQEEISLGGTRVRADHVLLRLGLSADISHLDAELRWARYAHATVSWLLTQDAIWPSARERPGAPTKKADDRQSAREELFSRMAARHRGPVSGEPGQSRDG